MASETLGAKAVGTVIRVTVNDDAVNEVIEMGFDRITFERSTDLGLSWAEITIPMDRPILKRDVPAYVWIDRMGSPTYLYRTKYINTRTGVLDEPSDTVEGAGIAVQGVLPIPLLLQRYMFGIDLTDDQGNRLPDAVFQFYILAGIEYLEHQLDIKILPTTYVEKQDYYASDYQQFNYLQLDNYPIISVDRFDVKYPTGQSVVSYPTEWLRVDPEHGHLRIVPTSGTLSEMLIGAGGSYLPIIYSGMGNLPHLFEIEYVAGFERIPNNILDLIGMLASLGPFNIFGDLITGAGIGNLSLSLDGLSQSITTTQSAMYGGYGSRVSQYLKQVKEQIPLLRRYYKGIRMAVA